MAAAQPASNRLPTLNDVMAPPTYKHQITPQAGPWLVCVQTFQGPHAQQMAEELAELLIRDFKIPSYLHDSGRKQREAENARVEKLREQHREMYLQMERQGLRTVDG